MHEMRHLFDKLQFRWRRRRRRRRDDDKKKKRNEFILMNKNVMKYDDDAHTTHSLSILFGEAAEWGSANRYQCNAMSSNSFKLISRQYFASLKITQNFRRVESLPYKSSSIRFSRIFSTPKCVGCTYTYRSASLRRATYFVACYLNIFCFHHPRQTANRLLLAQNFWLKQYFQLISNKIKSDHALSQIRTDPHRPSHTITWFDYLLNASVIRRYSHNASRHCEDSQINLLFYYRKEGKEKASSFLHQETPRPVMRTKMKFGSHRKKTIFATTHGYGLKVLAASHAPRTCASNKIY